LPSVFSKVYLAKSETEKGGFTRMSKGRKNLVVLSHLNG